MFSHFKEGFFFLFYTTISEKRNSPLDSNNSNLQEVTELNLFVCMQLLYFQKGVVLGNISLVIDPQLWSDLKIKNLFVKYTCLECPVYSLEFRRETFDFELEHDSATLWNLSSSPTVNIQAFKFIGRNPHGKLYLYMGHLNIVPEQDFQLCKWPVTKLNIC